MDIISRIDVANLQTISFANNAFKNSLICNIISIYHYCYSNNRYAYATNYHFLFYEFSIILRQEKIINFLLFSCFFIFS